MIIYKVSRCNKKDNVNVCLDEKIELRPILIPEEIKKALDNVEKGKVIFEIDRYTIEAIKTPIGELLKEFKKITGKTLPLKPNTKIYFSIQKRKNKNYRIVIFHYPLKEKVKKTLFSIPYSEELINILTELKRYWNKIVEEKNSANLL